MRRKTFILTGVIIAGLSVTYLCVPAILLHTRLIGTWTQERSTDKLALEFRPNNKVHLEYTLRRQDRRDDPVELTLGRTFEHDIGFDGVLIADHQYNERVRLANTVTGLSGGGTGRLRMSRAGQLQVEELDLWFEPGSGVSDFGAKFDGLLRKTE